MRKVFHVDPTVALQKMKRETKRRVIVSFILFKWLFRTILFGSHLKIGAAPSFQFRRITLNPTVSRLVINGEPPFAHYFFQISIAKSIAQIPTHTEQDDLILKIVPFE